MLEGVIIICLEKLVILPINKFIFIEHTLGACYLARETSHGHQLSLKLHIMALNMSLVVLYSPYTFMVKIMLLWKSQI